MRPQDSSLGRSYGLWTLLTMAASLLCLIIISTAGGLAGKIVIVIVAPVTLVINVAGVLLLAYVHWMDDSHPFFPHWLVPVFTIHGKRLPGLLLRVLDHFFALNLAWALIYVTVWTWDSAEERHTFFELALPAATHNVWAAWVAFMFYAFHIFVTFGAPEIAPTHVAGYLLVLADSIISWLVIALILAMVVTYAYEHARGRKKEKEGEDAAAAAAASETREVARAGAAYHAVPQQQQLRASVYSL